MQTTHPTRPAAGVRADGRPGFWTRAAHVLAVPGARPARVATDAVAVAGVVSLVLAAPRGPVAVALFALVLLGLTVPRVLGVPGWLQAVSGTVVVAAAWAALLGLYERWWWLDIAAHAAANGLLALFAFRLVVAGGLLPVPGGPAPRRLRAGAVLVTVTLGVTLGVVWELAEWFGNSFLDDGILVGYEDTLGDLVAGAAGSSVAGLLLARRPAAWRRDPLASPGRPAP
ncbi:hypothetical protein [Georgenia muralis]